MKQIKILHIIDFLQETGGAEKRLLNDLDLLNKTFSNEVFCTINHHKLTVEKLRKTNIPIHLSGKRYFFSKFLEIKNIITQIKPDIVHTQLFYSDILGRTAAKICRVPIILTTVQSSVHEPSAKFYYSRIRRFADMLTIRFCSKIIAVSEFVKQSISKRLFVNAEKITVIPNYINNFKIKQNRTNKNEIVLCCTGKILQAKGQSELIKAVNKLIKETVKIKLILAGDGPCRNACEKLVFDLRIKEHISFTGNTNKINEILGKSHAFIFPTHSEGLSLSLLEAVLAKKPCIISSIPPNLEIINSNNCLTFTPQNEESIYHAIKEFILLNNKNPEKLKTMVNDAYNNVMKKFNPTICIKKLEEIYVQSYAANTKKVSE